MSEKRKTSTEAGTATPRGEVVLSNLPVNFPSNFSAESARSINRFFEALGVPPRASTATSRKTNR